MDAKAPDRLSRGRRGFLAGSLVALLLSGLLPGCSDNNGRVTPTSATQTGDGIGGKFGSLFVQVIVNPGSINRGRRGNVVVIVTSDGGIPIAGRNVHLTSSVGSLDATSGQTDSAGTFGTTIFIPCDVAADESGNVIAIVDGVTTPQNSGAFTTTTATTNDPCA